MNSLVPGASSQLVASNMTSTSFCITISPPTNVTQNGPIQSYTVSYQGELFNTTQVNVSVSVGVVTYPLTASSSVCINGLEEFNNYTVAVRAVSIAGEGAAITQVVRTLTAGMHLLIILNVRVRRFFYSVPFLCVYLWTLHIFQCKHFIHLLLLYLKLS